MPKAATGVSGFDDAKFWLALICYGLSLPLFFEGNLSWDGFHVVMPFLISFIIVATVAWDYRIIGNPNNLFCLVLHLSFMASLVFLMNRLMTVEEFHPVLEGASSLGGMVVEVIKTVPGFGEIFRIFDFVLKWLGFAVILFLVSGAIIFPPRVASVLLLLFGVLFVMISVGQNLNPSLWSLGAGLVLLAVAFSLQLEDERKNRFWNMVAERLRRGSPRPAIDTRIKIALLRALHEEKSLSEKQIRGLVAGQLGVKSGDPAINPVCVRVADQLSNQDGLAESRDGNQGWRFVLTVPDEPPDFFAVCARVVRVVVTLGFCILYILSPIDLIPDATPVFGVVDDMLLGTAGLLSSVRTFYAASPSGGRQMGRLPFDISGKS